MFSFIAASFSKSSNIKFKCLKERKKYIYDYIKFFMMYSSCFTLDSDITHFYA